jgi:anthranilate synthase component 2
MNVLIIDNHDSFTWNLVQLVKQHGNSPFKVVRNHQVRLEEVQDYDKILLSPGPGLPADAGLACEVIRRYAATKSILGICLGHQAIAEVFGASLMNLSQVNHGVKVPVRIVDREDYLFGGLAESMEAGLYHSWAVAPDSLPGCLQVTAVTGDGLIMALRHLQYDVRGLQFHPESIMTACGKQIIHNWLSHQVS